MEDVCNELDSVKAESEKLKEEHRRRSEHYENLKKAHIEKLLELEETKQRVEKQSQELKVKCEEIDQARLLFDNLEFCLQEKESYLRDLSSLHEKLKADFEQKVATLEGEIRDLGLSLNEVMIRNNDLENDICARVKQIEGLKSLLSVMESKCSEAERMVREGKQSRRRDVVIGELEDEKESFRDRLKWKEEKFEHLEEAHGKLRDQFRRSEEEWERERSALVEESCSLRTQLDSQTRTMEGLRMQLEMCNDALAREESKRRSLEVQVSEFGSRFQTSVSQFEEETSEIQVSFAQRNEEIAKLQNSLGMKKIGVKEVELKIVPLERENQELRGSLKELHEAQIRSVGTTSSAKLHNKLRRVEQAHSNCSPKLKEKESELLSEIEKVREHVGRCESELAGKEEEAKKLRAEVLSCHYTIQELNEEISMILEVLKSELSEAYLTTYNVKVEMELYNKEKDNKISLLTAQLKANDSGLESVRLGLEEEKEKVESLTERLKSFQLMKQQEKRNLSQIAMEKDIHIKSLRKGFAALKEESRRRELETATLARLDAAKDFAEEKEVFLRVISEKERKIKNLTVLAAALERDLTNTSVSSFHDAVEKQVKIDALTEALEKHKCASIEEIEEKNVVIEYLKSEAENLHVLMKCNIDEQRRIEGIVKQLESDNSSLIRDNAKLSADRESLVAYIQRVCDGIGKLSSEDVEMMKALGKMLPRSEGRVELENSFGDSSISVTKKQVQASGYSRLPLKEVNLRHR